MPNAVGVTPLRAAARQGSFEMICLLVEAGAKQVFLEAGCEVEQELLVTVISLKTSTQPKEIN